jgi:hypothetical protein
MIVSPQSGIWRRPCEKTSRSRLVICVLYPRDESSGDFATRAALQNPSLSRDSETDPNTMRIIAIFCAFGESELFSDSSSRSIGIYLLVCLLIQGLTQPRTDMNGTFS